MSGRDPGLGETFGLYAADPIKVDGAARPFRVKDALVENNHDQAAWKEAAGHFRVNPNSIHTASQAAMLFTVELKTEG